MFIYSRSRAFSAIFCLFMWPTASFMVIGATIGLVIVLMHPWVGAFIGVLFVTAFLIGIVRGAGHGNLIPFVLIGSMITIGIMAWTHTPSEQPITPQPTMSEAFKTTLTQALNTTNQSDRENLARQLDALVTNSVDADARTLFIQMQSKQRMTHPTGCKSSDYQSYDFGAGKTYTTTTEQVNKYHASYDKATKQHKKDVFDPVWCTFYLNEQEVAANYQQQLLTLTRQA
jgi:hypothetical protein